ncbi:hypothetical protein, partial [Pseudomonas sp. 2822-17]|uniref:hypothetical protein n=1 Tax=Pseudomonas sp. 2822-17 TaxID=1712678 RepID=UPI001C449331
NPQTNIIKYDNSHNHVTKFLKYCFDDISLEEAIERYEHRLSILPHTNQLINNKIIYVQNTLDVLHYKNHFKPFVREYGLSEDINDRKADIETILFEHPGGHT